MCPETRPDKGRASITRHSLLVRADEKKCFHKSKRARVAHLWDLLDGLVRPVRIELGLELVRRCDAQLPALADLVLLRAFAEDACSVQPFFSKYVGDGGGAGDQQEKI